jgi:hypothetical protein
MNTGYWNALAWRCKPNSPLIAPLSLLPAVLNCCGEDSRCNHGRCHDKQLIDSIGYNMHSDLNLMTTTKDIDVVVDAVDSCQSIVKDLS